MHMLSLNLKSQNGSKNKSSYLQKQFLQKMHCDLMIVRYGLGRCTRFMVAQDTFGYYPNQCGKIFLFLVHNFFLGPMICI